MMSGTVHHPEALARLRESIGAVREDDGAVLPFALQKWTSGSPIGGLMLGGVHEVSAATPTLTDDAAATLFAIAVAARAAGKSGRRVLWALTRFDLYAPGLEQAGLDPATLLFVEAREDKDVLAVMEDGLRHGSLAAVIGEVRRADMVATRRLQLAAMTGKTPALLARRWRRPGVCPLAELSAAMTR
jgi:protein ImuA